MTRGTVAIVVLHLVDMDTLNDLLMRLSSSGISIVVVAAEPRQPTTVDVEWLCVRGSIPARRLEGARAARSEWIAMVEDTCVPGDKWLDYLRVLADDASLTGAWGPVKVAKCMPPRARALGLLEYGRFLPGQNRQIAVPGLCMIFHRKRLLDVLSEDGVFEQEAVHRLLNKGLTVAFSNDLSVTYRLADAWSLSLRCRYLHGRLYGGRRRTELPVWKRLLTPFAFPLIAATQLVRALRGSTDASAATFYWTLIFAASWALGECRGYVSGPGNSIEAWR